HASLRAPARLRAGRRPGTLDRRRCPLTSVDRSVNVGTSFAKRRNCSRRALSYAPAMPGDKSEHLTQAQKEQLEAELAELEGPRRAEAVEAIANARSFGDLSENFEYHAAKNEQGMLERRITMLRDRLDRAVIVDEDAAGASETVGVGTRVEIEDERGER